MKAIVTCICGTPHELAPGKSTRCHCGRVVLIEMDASTENHVRPWVDENSVDYPGNWPAPEIVGWRLDQRRGKK